MNASDRTPKSYPAEKARGGEIIPAQALAEIVLFGALAVTVLLGFFLSLWGR